VGAASTLGSSLESFRGHLTEGRKRSRWTVPSSTTDAARRSLDFLATTEVGRTAGPPVANKETSSEASEWEKREREEHLSQVAEEERALGEEAED